MSFWDFSVSPVSVRPEASRAQIRILTWIDGDRTNRAPDVSDI